MLRRVALTAALVALLPAGVAEAKKTPKKPVVTSVKPMQANIGDTITIYGRNFIKGKSKNTIAFRRDGAKTVFVKGDVSTLRQIRVVLPETLAPFLVKTGTEADFTRFRIRVLSRRFGKSFTPVAKSPRIGPAPAKVEGGTGTGAGPGTPGSPATPSAPAPTGNDDCDKDGVLNKNDADDDNDLLLDTQEAGVDANDPGLMTDPCAKDSDGDEMEDYFEYQSAIDLNDDGTQQPNTPLPYPGKRPYPNPLDGGDAAKDYDGDALTGTEEHALWRYTIDTTKTSNYAVGKLSYSAGLKYSVYGICNVDDSSAGVPCDDGGYDRNRRYPALKASNYDKIWGGSAAGACPTTPKTDDPSVGFYAWLKRCGYEKVELFWDAFLAPDSYSVDIRDVNLTGVLTDGDVTTPDGQSYPNSEYDEAPRSELYYYDLDKDDYLSDNERDEDADGLTNFDELHGRMLAEFWESCTGDVYGEYLPLDPFDADTDGDGVRDGADDEDRDDLPNMMELSRAAASGFDDTENGITGTWGVAGPGMSTCAKDKEAPKEFHHVNNGVRDYGEVNPFNPCLPYYGSRTCPEAFPEAVPAWFNSVAWYSLN